MMWSTWYIFIDCLDINVSYFLLYHDYSILLCWIFLVLDILLLLQCACVVKRKRDYKVNVQRGFLKYPQCEYTLLWSFQPLPLFSLTPPLPTSIIQQLSIHIVMSSTCTDVMHFNIVDSLSFFFTVWRGTRGKGKGEWRKWRWENMADRLHILIWNSMMKSLAIALSGAERGLCVGEIMEAV
jgi:hypothetical protein